MISKQNFNSRKELLGMVKPEITKVDLKDPNVISSLNDRELFSIKSANDKVAADGDVDVAGNGYTSTFTKNKILCTADNISTAALLHGEMLDYSTHMANAINLIRKQKTSVFNLSKFVTDVTDITDKALLTVVAYLSEHLPKFGDLLRDFAKHLEHVFIRLDNGCRDTARGVNGSSDEVKQAYIAELNEARECAKKLIINAEEATDAPYVEEVESADDLAPGTDYTPGKKSNQKGEVNS